MIHGSDNYVFRLYHEVAVHLMEMLDGANRNYRSDSHLSLVLASPECLLIPDDLAMTIQQAEIAKNIDEIKAQAVELHKRFSIFIDKFNDIVSNMN